MQQEAEAKLETESDAGKPFEVSLCVGENIYKQLLFATLKEVSYTRLVNTWRKYRDIEEVRTFVWVRTLDGYQKGYLIQDDEDLRSALTTEGSITIRAQGKGNVERNVGLGAALFVGLHWLFNWSLLWPLCRGDFWSVCLSGTSADAKGEL